MWNIVDVGALPGRGDADVSENEFVDKMIRRLEGHGSSLTTSIKNDADWDSFKSATFLQKVSCCLNQL